MKDKYIAFDGINAEHEHFDTIEEAQEYLKEAFLSDGSYHPDMKDCCIFKLCQKVDYDVTDKRSNYKYDREEDIPEDDNISEAWPFDCEFDEMWKHKFIDINTL